MQGQTRTKDCKSATCPFNSSHIMPAPTLQAHILKCTFKTKEFVQCIYNPMHWFKNNLIEQHERKCQSKILKEDDDDDWASITQNINKHQEEKKKQKKIDNAKQKEQKTEQKEQNKPQKKTYNGPSLGANYKNKQSAQKNVTDFFDEEDKKLTNKSHVEQW